MAPRTPVAHPAMVLYASGDGGWFGAAIDMFHQIGNAGYFAVGFSSRAFLRIEHPHGSLVTAAQLTAEYDQILSQARVALGLGPTTRAVLTGVVAWSGVFRTCWLGASGAGRHPGRDCHWAR